MNNNASSNLKAFIFFAVFALLITFSLYYVVATHISTGTAQATVNTSTITAPLNRSNFSGTVTFIVNVTQLIGWNVTNGSLMNSTIGGNGIWTILVRNNTQNLTEYRFVYATTNLPDGNQTYMFRVNLTTRNDTANTGAVLTDDFEVSAVISNITIDNTAPVVRLEGYTEDKGGELFQPTHYRNNGTGIRFNFTALDTLQFLGTCNLESSIGGAHVTNGTVIGATDQLNVTRGSSARVGPYSNAPNTTYVNLSDGSYTWNVRCNDTLGNVATNNTNYTLVIDTTAPTSSITLPTSNSIDLYSSYEIKCDGTDGTAGLNGTRIKVTKPNGNTYIKRATNESALFTFKIGGTTDSEEGLVPAKQTNAAGTYTVECQTVDRAGNAALSEKTFKVLNPDTVAAAGPSSTSIGPLPSATETPKTQEVGKGDTLTFTSKGIEHKAVIEEIGADYVVVKINPTFTVKLGETVKGDIDGDNVYDVAITLKSLRDGRADLSFNEISEPVPVTPTTPTTQAPTPTKAGTGAKAGKSTGAIVLGVIIVIIIVIAIIVMATKKKKKK